MRAIYPQASFLTRHEYASFSERSDSLFIAVNLFCCIYPDKCVNATEITRDYETYYSGKAMKSWASADTWESLHQTFACFDGDDSGKRFLATMKIFRRLATEMALKLEFSHP